MINQNNIQQVADALDLSNYANIKTLCIYISCRLMNEQYPSNTLIRAYLKLHQTKQLTNPNPSDERKKEMHDVFYRIIEINKNTIRIYEHDRKITDKVVKNLETLRDYINNFDEYLLEKYYAILDILYSLTAVQHRPAEEYLKFLDFVDENVKDKNFSDEILAMIYLGQMETIKNQKEPKEDQCQFY